MWNYPWMNSPPPQTPVQFIPFPMMPADDGGRKRRRYRDTEETALSAALKQVDEMKKWLEAQQPKKPEEKKEEKKGLSKLEVFMLLTALSPIIGPIYLWSTSKMLVATLEMLRPLMH